MEWTERASKTSPIQSDGKEVGWEDNGRWRVTLWRSLDRIECMKHLTKWYELCDVSHPIWSSLRERNPYGRSDATSSISSVSPSVSIRMWHIVRGWRWERDESMLLSEGTRMMNLLRLIEVRQDHWTRCRLCRRCWEEVLGGSSRACICKDRGWQLEPARLRNKITRSVLSLSRTSIWVTDADRKSDGGGCVFSVLESQQKCLRLGKRDPGGKWVAIWCMNGWCWVRLKTIDLICLAYSWKRPHSRELGGLLNDSIFSGYRWFNYSMSLL